MFQIQFKAIRGLAEYGDIAIDSINITAGDCEGRFRLYLILLTANSNCFIVLKYFCPFIHTLTLALNLPTLYT